jgi:hypothetical protein
VTWVTSAYLDNTIGTAARTALGLSGGVLSQYEAEARSVVASALQYAGYSVPTTITTTSLSGAFLAKLCAAHIVNNAFQYRKGVRLPFDPSGTITEGLAMLDAVHNKRLPVPGMTPDTLGGYGGSVGSPVTGDKARPAAFAVGKLRGF